MKKTLLVIVVVALLLCGCSLEAGPIQGTGSTVESTSLFPTIGTSLWDTNSLLSLVPLPKSGSNWEILSENSNGIEIVTEEFLLEDAEEYSQQLMDAGFCLDVYSRKDTDSSENLNTERFCFEARDEDWNVVTMLWSFDDWTDREDEQSCIITVLDLQVSAQPSSLDSKNSSSWDADLFRAMIPAPPTEYWTAQGTNGAKLQCVSIEDIREYSRELQAAGFVYKQQETLLLRQGSYNFIAQNAQGYTVALRYTNVMRGQVDASVSVYPIEVVDYICWDNSIPDFLPEPEVEIQDWAYTQGDSHQTILIYGMDYQEVLAYMEQIEQPGEDELERSLLAHWVEKDETAETIAGDFRLSVRLNDQTVIVYSFLLNYDAAAGDVLTLVIY